MSLFSRVKNWGTNDTLLASDLNAEFDNLISNMIPQSIVGYSATVNQMRTQTDGGEQGTESLATSLSGEIERLRFALAEIKGTTYWYQSSSTSLSQLASALGAASLSNRISSGLTLGTSSQPVFLLPDGSAAKITLKGSGTPFVYSIAGTQYTISTDVSVTSLTTAPTTANTCTVNDITLSGQAWTKLLGEHGSTITVSSMGASVSSLIGQIAAFKMGNASAEYMLCRVESTTQLTQVFRGYFFGSANTLLGRQTVTNGDTLTLVKLTWIYATTAGGLTVAYTNPSYGGTAPSSPAAQDYWFDTSTNTWKIYNSTTWVAANATLIGTCIQNSTATIGARSGDFFKAYDDTNTLEAIFESSTIVRSRNPGAQVNVYGTTLNFGQSLPQWSTSSLDSGESLTASTFYYLYITETGNLLISTISPLDRRGDLRGYYHPGNAYRCVGYVFYNASPAFNEVESFFRFDDGRQVSSLTAAVATYPLPVMVPPKQEIFECNSAGGAFTQILPPCSQWKGQRKIFTKTGTDFSQVTIQAFGSSVLSTTANTTQGGTTLSTLASTTGLVAGQAYLVSGPGIVSGTTVVWSSGSSATLSQNAFVTLTGTAVVFAYVPNVSSVSNPLCGISGNFTTSLNTPGETVELYSDGNCALIMSRHIPSTTYFAGTVSGTLTAVTTAPTKGTVTLDQITWERQGSKMIARYEYVQTAGGTAGSGIYLWAVPSSQTMDSSRVTFDTATSPIKPTHLGFGRTGNAASDVANASTIMEMYAYDTTHMAGLYLNAVSAADGKSFSTIASGTNGNLGQTNIRFSFTVTIPILGWN